MKRDIQIAPGVAMKTIALVRATPETAPWAAQTIAALASGGLSCAGIVVVGGDPLGDFVTAAGGIPVSRVSEGESLAAVKARVWDTGAAGVVVVSAGMHLPYGFDVRLARAALGDALVGTVSPFCDLAPAHRLREAADAPALVPVEARSLDRLAYLLGQRSYFGVDECLPECCFVPAAAFERLAAAASTAKPGTARWWAPLTDAGFIHVLADSVYVAPLPEAGIAVRAGTRRAQPAALAQSRKAIVAAHAAGISFGDMPAVDSRPVQLHVIHDLGGGTVKWLRDFALADAARSNLVLRSFSHGRAAGNGVALYTHVLDEVPLRVWNFAAPIEATVTTHLEYRRALAEVVAQYCVDVLLISSLIGHSLDVLDTGLPTVVVNHDYFPYCPAINIYFGGVCRQCDGQRIGECHRVNTHFNPFVEFTPPERERVREKFTELARRPQVTMAIPSRSVADNLTRLNPVFGEVAFQVIAHGYGHALARVDAAAPSAGERLRILVLGQLSRLKGVELLRAALGSITQFADVYLVGCRELGEAFQYLPHVHVISQYEIDELPAHVANINPHVGLLTSIAPETFNYALTELMMLGVPPVATRVGSFPERIRHGEDGYLYEPDPGSLVRLLKAIDVDREALGRIRGNLAGWKARSAEEMVADYHRITPVPAATFARYPPGKPPATEAAGEAQAVTVAGMWKEMKSLHLQLTVAREARHREERQFRKTAEELQERAEFLARSVAGQEASLAEKERHIHGLTIQRDAKSAQLDEMRASTSWRISGPVRVAGRVARQLRTVARCVAAAARDPASLPKNGRRLARAWRFGGMPALKKALLDLQAIEGLKDAWAEYRRTFQRDVRPRLVERVRAMKARPRVSVLVATYNTPELMLRNMIESVQAQLYPEWELCIADDASSEPRVARILEQYAAKDPRIRLHLGKDNRGVSHALNRALELVTAQFAVLLDHDDVLEEHALFRVAECVAEDDPDIAYSDEVLVTPAGDKVERYALRPAFSREFLRGHPYIVHLAGFRTTLLRDIGGFDEDLRISQDYDLLLRASERARAIAHIPEILYQWRIHGASAGSRKKHEVMERSKAVLRRHLERCGEDGTVEDGRSFNLFDVRYPLAPGLKVAIIIPTKNHGDLVRQCVESIWATVPNAAYDIVIVDHASDDPDTLEYLASIASSVRIVRYEGAFNFSDINNRAVAQLDAEYSHYLFCNNDIQAIEPGWLERMLELGQQPSVGIVGAMLLYPDRRTIQHAGVCVGAYGAAEHYGKHLSFPPDPFETPFPENLSVSHEVAAVTAACLLIRRDAFEEVRGFDAAIAVGFGDVDLCLRVGERGYRVVFCPHAELVHHESYTRGTSVVDPHPEDSALFRFKWKERLQAGDPYHNPGLSLESTNRAILQPLACVETIRRRIVRRDAASGRESIAFSESP